MNTQNEEPRITASRIADAFYKIDEPGLAFAVNNFSEDKTAQFADALKRAGFTIKEQRAQK